MDTHYPPAYAIGDLSSCCKKISDKGNWGLKGLWWQFGDAAHQGGEGTVTKAQGSWPH